MCETSLALCDDGMGVPHGCPSARFPAANRVSRKMSSRTIGLDAVRIRQHNLRMARRSAKDATGSGERRKLIAFDDETWNALDLLARDSMSTIQELADEAFRDLLRKHNRPVDLKSALRESVRAQVPAKAPPAPKRERT